MSTEVQIPGTVRHELLSRHTGRVYEISIGLPDGYGTAARYPVMYVLDGQWDFKLVMSVYGALCFDMFVPDAIVVGIAAGGDDPDHEALRIRDYTPTALDDFEGSGDAHGFLAFLSEELIPFVEQRYQADQHDRTLVGSSLGGLFALHALFTDPEQFGRFVVVSPALFWDERVVKAQEDRLAARVTDLPVRLFLAAGELEPSIAFLRPLDRLVDRIRERRYGALQLMHMVIAGERHAGVKAEAFNRGLRWVFTPPAFDLPPDALLDYVGEYEYDDLRRASAWWPGRCGRPRLRLLVNGDRLVVDAEPGIHDGDELVPVAEDRFTFKGSIPGEATFLRDSLGTVDRLSIRLPEQTLVMERTR